MTPQTLKSLIKHWQFAGNNAAKNKWWDYMNYCFNRRDSLINELVSWKVK